MPRATKGSGEIAAPRSKATSTKINIAKSTQSPVGKLQSVNNVSPANLYTLRRAKPGLSDVKPSGTGNKRITDSKKNLQGLSKAVTDSEESTKPTDEVHKHPQGGGNLPTTTDTGRFDMARQKLISSKHWIQNKVAVAKDKFNSLSGRWKAAIIISVLILFITLILLIAISGGSHDGRQDSDSYKPTPFSFTFPDVLTLELLLVAEEPYTRNKYGGEQGKGVVLKRLYEVQKDTLWPITNPQIYIRLADLITVRKSDIRKSHTGSRSTLRSFKEWLKRNAAGTKYDVAAFIPRERPGFTLKFQKIDDHRENYVNYGFTNAIGSCCLKSNSTVVAVSERSLYHELIHLLGGRHDFNKPECPEQNYFYMGGEEYPTPGVSICVYKQILTYIKSNYERTKCLREINNPNSIPISGWDVPEESGISISKGDLNSGQRSEDAQWESWLPWTECTDKHLCLGGWRSRTRICRGRRANGKPCARGEAMQSEICDHACTPPELVKFLPKNKPPPPDCFDTENDKRDKRECLQFIDPSYTFLRALKGTKCNKTYWTIEAAWDICCGTVTRYCDHVIFNLTREWF